MLKTLVNFALKDRFSEDYVEPHIDSSQDYVVENGYENDTHTVVTFSRVWDTCDDKVN